MKTATLANKPNLFRIYVAELFLKKYFRVGFFIFGLFFLSIPAVYAEDAFFLDIEGQPDWSGEVEVGLVFDDNIFQEKEEKISDTIMESAILLNALVGETVFNALAMFNHYRDNSSLNDAFYEIGVEVPLNRTFYAGGALSLMPSAPLDKEERRPTPFELSSRSLSGFIDHEVSWGLVGASFLWTNLNYSPDFNAKDSQIFTFGPSLFYVHENTDWTVYTDLAFERGRARGGHLLIRCPVSSEVLLRACRNLLIGEGFSCDFAQCRRGDDISYRAVIFSMQTRYQVSSKFEMSLKYRIRGKKFTTDADDPIHHGRRDDNHLIVVEGQYRPHSRIRLRIRLEEIWTRSSDPLVEFTERRLSFSTTYTF